MAKRSADTREAITKDEIDKDDPEVGEETFSLAGGIPANVIDVSSDE